MKDLVFGSNFIAGKEALVFGFGPRPGFWNHKVIPE